MFKWLLGGGKSLDETVINIQKGITLVLMAILVFLIVYNAFGDSKNSQTLNNSYLPIISGWMGVILGFYFSREIADIINKKLKETQKERKEDTEKIVEEYENFKRQTSEVIIELLNKLNKKIRKNDKRTGRNK